MHFSYTVVCHCVIYYTISEFPFQSAFYWNALILLQFSEVIYLSYSDDHNYKNTCEALSITLNKS